ncbi:MAG TPA: radical SAM protein, partial [Desulfosarcina sp.]|nr:radical SAM protein [Desulfosarcina sp.]
FYDDALLVDTECHALPLFKRIVALGLGVRFHTPNAIHIREITDESAEWMAAAGFHTLRLGLETTAFESRRHLDRKVTEAEFLRAVGCLKRAGFRKSQVGAYLLAGLPGQSLAAVFESIDLVNASGITPIPAYYSPIPGTRLWPEACAASRYDLAADPVFTNNAVFPCRPEGFSWEILTAIRDRVRAV